jgi:hypothetical protein
MSVRPFLMAFTPLDVQNAESVRHFANAYKDIYAELFEDAPEIDNQTHYLLYPLDFLQSAYPLAKARVMTKLFKQAFPEVEL